MAKQTTMVRKDPKAVHQELFSNSLKRPITENVDSGSEIPVRKRKLSENSDVATIEVNKRTHLLPDSSDEEEEKSKTNHHEEKEKERPEKQEVPASPAEKAEETEEKKDEDEEETAKGEEEVIDMLKNDEAPKETLNEQADEQIPKEESPNSDSDDDVEAALKEIDEEEKENINKFECLKDTSNSSDSNSPESRLPKMNDDIKEFSSSSESEVAKLASSKTEIGKNVYSDSLSDSGPENGEKAAKGKTLTPKKRNSPARRVVEPADNSSSDSEDEYVDTRYRW